MSNASNISGQNFEATLTTINQIYEERKLARFRKVAPPTRTIGTGAFRRIIYLENPFLDYVGCMASGRAMFFEAKSTAKPSLAAGGKDGFTEKQFNAMQDWRAAGAGAFLLWEYQGQGVRLFAECMIAAGLEERKSLVWYDGLEVPPGHGFIFYDFLKVVNQYPQIL